MNTLQQEQTNKMYRLLEQLNITALEEISAILYEHASPFGEINTHVGKWVFVNPANKQWYSKDELATARAEGAERIGKQAVLDYIMALGWQDTDSEYVKEVIKDADRLAEELQALTTKEHHAS